MSSRPCDLSYGKVVSPNFSPESPDNKGFKSPDFSAGSPVYNPGTPESQRSKSMYVTRTSAVYIPRWAASYVFGGRDMKHFHNLCKKHGNYVTNVPFSEGKNWTTFKQPNGQILAILTLIGYGESETVEDAMQAVEDGLVDALYKAKQMKDNGTWREHSDRNNNSRHRHQGGRHQGGRQEDRSNRRNHEDRSNRRNHEDRRMEYHRHHAERHY